MTARTAAGTRGKGFVRVGLVLGGFVLLNLCLILFQDRGGATQIGRDDGKPMVSRNAGGATDLAPARAAGHAEAETKADRLTGMAAAVPGDPGGFAGVVPVGNPALPAPSATDLRHLTSGVVAKLLAARETVPGAPAAGLQYLIEQSLAQGQSDAYIDALLNEAVDGGGIDVPQALVTAEGRVDTATLLASLVARSGGLADRGDRDMEGTPKAAVMQLRKANAMTAPPTRPARVYIVQPGDSLAAISLRFYGRIDEYDTIFAANRDRLPSPDLITTGQRLTIPAL